MVCSMSCASFGSTVLRFGIMLVPEQEVRILVFCGLTKHPLDFPSFSISVQKNWTSWWCTVDDMSSIYASRCAMLPKPSSPLSPFCNRSAALLRS